MSFEPHDYLGHILAESEYLCATSEGLTSTDFVTDETLQRAFVRSLEIIREAAKKVPDSFRADHSDIGWRAMAGMRDRLIHDYFGVDYEIV
ncbi:MAG: HepT-like ribonuclease domain-containing protein [Gemmatimonadota bacterium]